MVIPFPLMVKIEGVCGCISFLWLVVFLEKGGETEFEGSLELDERSDLTDLD